LNEEWASLIPYQRLVTDTFSRMFVEKDSYQALQLKIGQIIHGEILQLLSEKEAIVTIQGKKCIAKLEVPLQQGQSAWFIVGNDTKQIKLKLLTGTMDSPLTNHQVPQVDEKQILRYLNLPVNSINKQIVQSFFEQQIPFEKNALQIAANLIKENNSITEVVQAVKLVLEKNLPLTEVHLRGILEFSQNNLVPKIEQLNQQIFNFLAEKKTDSKNNLSESLKLQLETLYSKGNEIVRSFQLDPSLFILDGQKQNEKQSEQLLLKLTSFFEEISIMDTERIAAKTEQQYKDLITSIQKESNVVPENLKTSLDKVSHHLLGQLLLTVPSIDTNQPYHFVVMQIPGSPPFTQKGITVQIQSQKRNGKLDADELQIAFLFSLPHLGEVVAKIHVMKKNLIIQVINDHPQISTIIKQLEPSLIEMLHTKGYKTSGITTITKKKEKQSSFVPSYQGVDIRI